jgi:hypothetical protein
MANEPTSTPPASTKYEIELSAEMATLLKGLGIPSSTKISSPDDLALFSRIGSLAQQFGTSSAALTPSAAIIKPTDGPVTNQMWCGRVAQN